MRLAGNPATGTAARLREWAVPTTSIDDAGDHHEIGSNGTVEAIWPLRAAACLPRTGAVRRASLLCSSQKETVSSLAPAWMSMCQAVASTCTHPCRGHAPWTRGRPEPGDGSARAWWPVLLACRSCDRAQPVHLPQARGPAVSRGARRHGADGASEGLARRDVRLRAPVKRPLAGPRRLCGLQRDGLQALGRGWALRPRVREERG